jgi:hypothetical protein
MVLGMAHFRGVEEGPVKLRAHGMSDAGRDGLFAMTHLATCILIVCVTVGNGRLVLSLLDVPRGH